MIYRYIDIVSFMTIILSAALFRDYVMAAIVAVIVMVIANFVSQIIIAGGGLIACIGFFIMPVFGILSAWITVWLTLLISKIIKQKRNNGRNNGGQAPKNTEMH